jgi:hypothetical protein
MGELLEQLQVIYKNGLKPDANMRRFEIGRG